MINHLFGQLKCTDTPLLGGRSEEADKITVIKNILHIPIKVVQKSGTITSMHNVIIIILNKIYKTNLLVILFPSFQITPCNLIDTVVGLTVGRYQYSDMTSDFRFFYSPQNVTLAARQQHQR